MEITEKEMVMLMNESTNGKFIQCDFGVGWVALQNIPENQWAIDRINEVRNPVSI